jgi:hypothetical protein
MISRLLNQLELCRPFGRAVPSSACFCFLAIMPEMPLQFQRTLCEKKVNFGLIKTFGGRAIRLAIARKRG